MTTTSRGPGVEPTEPIEPFDPFELQDSVAGTVRDPFPAMRDYLRQNPVQLGHVDLGGEQPPEWIDRPEPVTVLGYDEVIHVLKDHETFSSPIYEGVMGMVMGRTILQMDEPEHRSSGPSWRRPSAPRCSSAGRATWSGPWSTN